MSAFQGLRWGVLSQVGTANQEFLTHMLLLTALRAGAEGVGCHSRTLTVCPTSLNYFSSPLPSNNQLHSILTPSLTTTDSTFVAVLLHFSDVLTHRDGQTKSSCWNMLWKYLHLWVRKPQKIQIWRENNVELCCFLEFFKLYVQLQVLHFQPSCSDSQRSRAQPKVCYTVEQYLNSPWIELVWQ